MKVSKFKLFPSNDEIIVNLANAEKSFKEAIRLDRIINDYGARLEEYPTKLRITAKQSIMKDGLLYYAIIDYFCYREEKKIAYNIERLPDFILKIQRFGELESIEAMEEVKDFIFLASNYNAEYIEIDDQKAIVKCPDEFAWTQLFADYGKYFNQMCKA